jgi:hypothetical protein
MRKGFDSNVDLTRFAASLKAKGYDFVARYYNVNNPSKNLTLAEAHVLSSAGLGIVVVWENGYPTSYSYFNYEKGVNDGTSAYFFASNRIHQPAGTPIYFAVDYDASPAEISVGIFDYFRGLQDGFNTISQNNPIYTLGIYGSGLTCSTILNSGKAAYAWLAQSMGWQGSRTFTNYNIKQALDTTECSELGGVSGDPDESPDDNEGSFTVSAFVAA